MYGMLPVFDTLALRLGLVQCVRQFWCHRSSRTDEA